MGKGTSIAGRTHFSGPDFYCTPAWATHALMERESFAGRIWEPASGNGAMVNIIRQYYDDVVASDIQEEDYVCGLQGRDFLDESSAFSQVSNIITNPPYKLAQEFINRALDVATDKVAMLLKLTFLESTKRHAWWQTVPLKKVWVFSRRVTMYPYGTTKPKNSGTITYAWFVWKIGYRNPPTIGWIE